MSKSKAPRRRYGEEFKRQVVAEASATNVSVSEIARRHGLNANQVFNWRKKYGAETPVLKLPEVRMLPVEIGAAEASHVDVLATEQSPASCAPDPSVADSSWTAMIEVNLPCGTRLRCSAGMEPSLLGQALTALRPDTQDDST